MLLTELTKTVSETQGIGCAVSFKGCMPSALTPKSSWDDESSKDGLDAEKPHRNYVQSNSKRTGNVSVHIPNRFGVF